MQVTFKYYNVEVLPIAEGSKEIGSKGYKRVFELYKELVHRAKKDQSLHLLAAPLRSEYLFSGTTILIGDEFSFGEFMKFHHSDSLENLYNSDDTRPIPTSFSAKIYRYEYVFDYKRHVLAIQDNRLPSITPLIQALMTELGKVVNEEFPGYILSINELTLNESLEELYAADAYTNLEVNVAFSNSRAMRDEYEQDLKDNYVAKAYLKETAAPQAPMIGITKHMKAFLELARQHGDAYGTIIVDGVKKKFQMKDKPVRSTVKKRKEDSDRTYQINKLLSIRNALSQTQSDQENQLSEDRIDLIRDNDES